jgi:hypothetical protein
MAHRATLVSQDPLNYFLQPSDVGPYIRVSDVVLRVNLSPRDVFSGIIRFATNSAWSHSALLYLISDPLQGYDNTFLVEAMTSGIRVASWRNEVFPFETFTVGIRRLPLDWYVETPHDIARHNHSDPEDIPGIAYLRHVRGMALDQVNGLYDRNTIYEMVALYAERVAKRHFAAIPEIAAAAGRAADLFRKWDESDASSSAVLRFICSGLVQYSFFSALRRRIINDLAVPEHRAAAMSNLSNMHRVIVHPDPEGIIDNYVKQVQAGKLDLAADVPKEVTDLLKTTTPADFNNSPNLEWRYVIRRGWVWQIDTAPDDYKPQSDDEAAVLNLMKPEHRSDPHQS